MEYAYGLGPYAERLGGSSPFPRTFIDVQDLKPTRTPTVRVRAAGFGGGTE